MTAKIHEWPGSIISAAAILLCVGTAEFGCGAAAEPAPLPDSVSADAMLIARGLVNAGDSARLQRVMIRASQGNPVTVAVIGGSITAGAAATQPEKRYGNRVAQWWRQKFPAAQIKFVNAGIGATGSDYGALRADRDLLSKQPDFVVIEYAVNDRNTQAAAETLEGLVRHILKQPNQPAVMLLFTMDRKGNNAQEWHGKVGRHYGLPMVSFRDAMWPEIQSGRKKWEDVEADQVHPNDQGHAYCAEFVTAVLDQVLRNLPTKNTRPEVKALPPPLFNDLFEHTALHEADALKPTVNRGWVHDPKRTAWKSEEPGSVIEFEVDGRVVFTMHYVVKGPMGRTRVSIDGKDGRELEGWFDQTWGGYRQLNEVARWQESGKHRVRFELLETTDRGSQFHILGLGTAGLRSPSQPPGLLEPLSNP